MRNKPSVLILLVITLLAAACEKFGARAANPIYPPDESKSDGSEMSYREWLIGMALAAGRSPADAIRDADEVLKQVDGATHKNTVPGQTQPAETSEKFLNLKLGGWVALKTVLIPSGEFMMGSPTSEQDRGIQEGPQHRVRITQPFYMGKYEIGQSQWEAVMGDNPSHFKGRQCETRYPP